MRVQFSHRVTYSMMSTASECFMTCVYDSSMMFSFQLNFKQFIFVFRMKHDCRIMSMNLNEVCEIHHVYEHMRLL